MKAKVEIVWDSGRSKLRAKPVGRNGWVRFPTKLRVRGAVYEVDDLRPGQSGSWIVAGKIHKITKE